MKFETRIVSFVVLIVFIAGILIYPLKVPISIDAHADAPTETPFVTSTPTISPTPDLIETPTPTGNPIPTPPPVTPSDSPAITPSPTPTLEPTPTPSVPQSVWEVDTVSASLFTHNSAKISATVSLIESGSWNAQTFYVTYWEEGSPELKTTVSSSFDTGNNSCELTLTNLKYSTNYSYQAYLTDTTLSQIKTFSTQQLPVITIAEARESGVGSVVKVSGIVTKVVDIASAFIQDSSAGIVIKENLSTNLISGDGVEIMGTICEIEGQLFIEPLSKTILSRGQTLPNPFFTSIGSINSGGHQGEIIRLEGVKIVGIDAENLLLRDEATNQYIQVYKYFPLNIGIGINSKVDVIAVVSSKLNVPILRTDNSGDIVFTKVPVEIYTEEELDAMRNNMVYNYKLMNDITLTKNWVTVGDNTRKYSATFDGQGHKISNFNVVLDQEYQFYYAGFIGNLAPIGRVKDLSIEMTAQSGAVRAFNIDDNTYAGGIAGVNEGTIDNCHVTGKVEGKNYVGGIAGLSFGSLNNCTFSGSIKGLGNNVGGIIGYCSVSLDNCQSTGTVAGMNYVGGLVGYSYDSTKTITNSNSQSSVSGTNSVGGLIGLNFMNINNCHASGDVKGTAEVGGFIGTNHGGTIQNNDSKIGSIYGTNKIGGFIGYLYSGNISNNFSENDVNSTSGDTGGFVGVLSVTLTNCFAKGRVVSSGGNNVGGLVGKVITSNVIINNCYSIGDICANSSYVGGLVGNTQANGGSLTITSSYSVSNVSATGSYIGGLYGGATYYYYGGGVNYINISKSYSKGNIRGGVNNVGGLIGSDGVEGYPNYGSIITIEKSYSLGDIKGADNVGGCAGRIVCPESSVINSFANGNVSGNANIGGFVGQLYSAVIRNNYSNGKVVAKAPTTSGGLVGKNNGISNTIRNYFDAETSGQGDDTKGIPKTTAQMKNPTSYVGWDFSEVWSMTAEVNNGYPVLRNMPNDNDINKKPIILIYTAEDLSDIRNNPGESYKLANDISLSGNWTPIGMDRPFFGVLDGDNHKISGLKVINSNDRSGLFANTSVAYIKNLNVEGIIKGTGNVGILIGRADSSTIENCSTAGSVYGSNDYLGGLIGYSYGGELFRSSSNATVITTDDSNYMGGFIGASDNAVVDQCFAKGNVYSNELSNKNYRYFGGLIGSFNGTLTNSYATGDVKGVSFVSGLLGTTSSQIKNSYSTGRANFGLFYYPWGGSPAATSSYWDVNTSGTSSSTSGIGKSTTEMKNVTTYVGWDFNSIWEIAPDKNDGYPYLRTAAQTFSADFSSEIQIINSESDLKNIANDLTGLYKLNNDIELTSDWSPLGNSTTPFFGTIDGDNHKIIGLNIPADKGGNYAGLIGMMGSTGVIRNLSVEIKEDGKVEANNDSSFAGGLVAYSRGEITDCTVTGNISGRNYVGGVVGYLTGATIKNCHSYGTIKGSGTYIGGIVGKADSCNILDCSSSGIFSSKGSYIGGLVGYSNLNTIEKCSTSGRVFGQDNYIAGLVGGSNGGVLRTSNSSADVFIFSNGSYMGGLVGYAGGITIDQCYATGKIAGNNPRGGLIGGLYSSTLTNSFASGNVKGGCGLIGETSYSNIRNVYSTGSSSTGLFNNSSYMNFEFNFWDVQTSGTTNGYGGTGKTTLQMKTQGTYTGWDFNSIWGISENVNNGYPYLRNTAQEANNILPVKLIFNETDLKNIKNDLTGMYKLGNDISLSEDWTPIGDNSASFLGVFDGNNYKITGLNVPADKGGNYAGFFGIMGSSGIIKDLSIEIREDGKVEAADSESSYAGGLVAKTSGSIINCNVSGDVVGKNYVGGLTGIVERGSVNNSFSKGSVIATGSYVGGLIGIVDRGSVNNSFSKGSVIATGSYVGGLIGLYCSDNNIANCYSESSVSAGSSMVGGLIGQAQYYGYQLSIKNCHASGNVTSNGSGNYTGGLIGYATTSLVEKCFATGTVTGCNDVGGLIGYANGVTECYSIGNVNATGSGSGGLVGRSEGTGINNSYASGNVTGLSYTGGLMGWGSSPITNSYATGRATNGLWSYNWWITINSSYWDVQTSGTTSGYSYSTFGKTTEQMNTISTYVGWDFNTIWAIDTDKNNGYPYLRFMVPTATSVTVSSTKTTLYVGEAEKFEYTISPNGAPNMISWSSSDETVAIVNNSGVVIAMKEGRADIMVTTGNGVMGKLSIVVLQQQKVGNIVAISPFSEQSVPYSTSMNSVLSMLPDMIEVTLEGGAKATLPVDWTLVEGSAYSFTGNIVLLADSPITNSNNIVVTANIIRQPQPQAIVSAEEIAESVPNGTNLANVHSLLPTSVNVTLADARVVALDVVWDNDSSPSYRSTTTGAYSFSGTILLPEDGLVLNGTSIKARAVVTVLPVPPKVKKITGAVTNQTVHILNGTALAAARESLPASVYVVLDNIETVAIPVSWSNNSNPEYKQYIADTYTFTGTISLPSDGFTQNPLNIKSTINVVVDPVITGPKNLVISNETGRVSEGTTVKFEIDAGMNMTSGSFLIDFDSTKLTPLEYTIGPVLEGAGVMVNLNYIDPISKNRKIKVSFMTVTPISLGDNMISIKFLIASSVPDNTVIPISVSSLELYDSSENALPCTIIAGSIKAYEIVLGDVNGDGKINILDAYRIMKYDAGLVTLTDKQLVAADIDKNGVVDIYDAMKIQRFDLGLTDILG